MPVPQPQSTTPAPAPAPEPTTTTEPEPATPAPAPEPTTTAPDNNNGGNNGGDDESVGYVNKDGFATWYEQDSNEAACGGVHTNDELIGAIQEQRYGPVSGRASLCIFAYS